MASARSFIDVNFDTLVKKIPVNAVLDRLVQDGLLSSSEDDYQDIQTEYSKSRNAGARRLLRTVQHLPRQDGETVFRRILADVCPTILENLRNPVAASMPTGTDTEALQSRAKWSWCIDWIRRPAVSNFIPLLIFCISLLYQQSQTRLSRRSALELPASVSHLREVLAKAIRDRVHDSPLPWLDEVPKPGQALYVNLVIVRKRQLAEKNDKSDLVDRSAMPAHKLSSTEVQNRVAVNLSAIWDANAAPKTRDLRSAGNDNSKADTISRILVRAGAGMGKTFTFAKIAPYQWLVNDFFWPDIDLLFVIHLGDPLVQEVRSLEELFFKDFKILPSTVSEVMEYVGRKSDRILLICDALDEGEGHIPPVLKQLLEGKLLPGLRILVTSRPCGEATELASHFHRHLELLGLAEIDLPEFLNKHLKGNATLTKSLLERARNSDFLMNLMGSPLIASLVCRLFQFNRDLPGSTTKLFEGIFLNLLRRAREKRFPDFLSSEDKTCDHLFCLSSGVSLKLEQVGKLAIEGLKKRKSVFTQREAEEFSLSEEMLESGLLIKSSKTGSSLSRIDTFTFFHTSFMEFSAAYSFVRFCIPYVVPPAERNELVTLAQQEAILDCVAKRLWEDLPLAGPQTEALVIGDDSTVMVWFFSAALISLVPVRETLKGEVDCMNTVENIQKLKEGLSQETATSLLTTLAAFQRASETYTESSINGFHLPQGFAWIKATFSVVGPKIPKKAEVPTPFDRSMHTVVATADTSDTAEINDLLFCDEGNSPTVVRLKLEELLDTPQLRILKTLTYEQFFPRANYRKQVEWYNANLPYCAFLSYLAAPVLLWYTSSVIIILFAIGFRFSWVVWPRFISGNLHATHIVELCKDFSLSLCFPSLLSIFCSKFVQILETQAKGNE